MVQVTVAVTARVPSSTGREGEGLPYFQTRQQEDGLGVDQGASKAGPPLTWVMGEGRVPRGLEEAVGSLARGERSFVSCPADQASGGELLPAPPAGVERVEFELELLSMLQVIPRGTPTFLKFVDIFHESEVELLSMLQVMPLVAPTFFGNCQHFPRISVKFQPG